MYRLKLIVDNQVKKLKDDGVTGPIAINALKETLQYTVLDFIYNNAQYSNWVMYGGTALRICYGLERMSEDLDFQVDKKVDLVKLEKNLLEYYKQEFGVLEEDISVSTKDRNHIGTDMVTINFGNLIKDLDVGVNWNTLKIKIDLNHFDTSKFEHELIPKVKDSFTFSIRTYPISTLMASKIVAVFNRNKRNMGSYEAEYKGRDIYDIIWYMKKKIIPNIDYLKAVGLEVKNILDIFDKLFKRVVHLDEKALALDLPSLFYQRNDFDLWFRNWRETFMSLRYEYKFYKIDILTVIRIHKDFATETWYAHYIFDTTDGNDSVRITFRFSDRLLRFKDIKIEDKEYKDLVDRSKVDARSELPEIIYEYLGLFYIKIEDYLKKTDRILTTDELTTKFITSSRFASHFDPKTQIIQDNGQIEESVLEDLL